LNTRLMAAMTGVCGVLLFCWALGASAGDYSVTLNNKIFQTTNETGSSCNPVSLTYWSGGTGSKAQTSRPLSANSPQTLTIRNAGSCSSLEITATCHYFQTVFTNKGRPSQTAYSHWVDDTKTQGFSCCHTVDIGIAESTAGNVTYQVLGITCR
jgi:hypothetical protein